MFRFLLPVSRFLKQPTVLQQVVPKPVECRHFTSLIPVSMSAPKPSLLTQLTPISHNIARNLIKFSLTRGKRKSVTAVNMRFYRLGWGGWIRCMAGRSKRLWKKHSARRRRLRQHVLCNATQSTLLDKMSGKFWTRRKYYVDDPYEPYHERENFSFSAKKPKAFIPPSGSVPNC